jgi:hypothetical protein
VGSSFDLLDEPLWQLHTVDAFLPPHLLEHSAVVVNGNKGGDSTTTTTAVNATTVNTTNSSTATSSSETSKQPRESVLVDIGATFKELLRVMRAHEWKRQDSLRWMDPDAYARSVNQATAVQRSLDSIHLTVRIERDKIGSHS